MTSVERRGAARVTDEVLEVVDAYWRAANYLSVGQIYLQHNPLLTEALRPEHIKPRLLGHWGTTPGLNLVLAHLNRAIVDRDLDVLYVLGPGHGGPAALATAWLDDTYSETHPSVSRDAAGMRRLFRQSPTRVASPATWRPRHPARSTRAVNWGTRSRTPTERRSTTRTCWWRA